MMPGRRIPAVELARIVEGMAARRALRHRTEPAQPPHRSVATGEPRAEAVARTLDVEQRLNRAWRLVRTSARLIAETAVVVRQSEQRLQRSHVALQDLVRAASARPGETGSPAETATPERISAGARTPPEDTRSRRSRESLQG
jgi:hypothetical protein